MSSSLASRLWHFLKSLGFIAARTLLFVLLFAASVAGVAALSDPITSLGKPWSVAVFDLLPMLGLILVGILLKQTIDRRNDIRIGLPRAAVATRLLQGIALGLAWLAAALLIIAVGARIHLSTAPTLSVTTLLVTFLAVTANAITQELLVRGYLWGLIESRWGQSTGGWHHVASALTSSACHSLPGSAGWLCAFPFLQRAPATNREGGCREEGASP